MAFAHNANGEPEEKLQQTIPVPDNHELNFGLRWDFVGDEPFDLDVSCVSFDIAGNVGELVYFNNLTTTGEWMVHTGDNTTGEGDDDDEAVHVILSKVPAQVFSLVLTITCHNTGCNLSKVDSIVCQVIDLTVNELLCTLPVHLSKDHTAIIVCNLHRTDPTAPDDTSSWILQELNTPAQGHSVGDHSLLLKVRDLLPIYAGALTDRKELTVVIDSTKRSAGQIRADVKHLVFGVGWLKGHDDIDCTVIYFSKDRRYMDHVNSKNKLVSTDEATIHQGDNVLNASNKGTDKEKVDLFINKVDDAADMVFFCVSTVEREGKWVGRLPQVSGAYCRLLEVKQKVVGKGASHNIEDRKELVRCNLSRIAKDAVGFIFAAIYRDPTKPSGWCVQSIQEPLPSLPCSAVSPAEFIPVSRSLTHFLRAGFKSATEEWVIGGWESFREAAKKKKNVTITVVEGRNLGPQGKKFSCHCQLWVMDSGTATQKCRTVVTADRTRPQWNETFHFRITLLDAIKIVCFDTTFVGAVELLLVQHHGTNFALLQEMWHPLAGEDVEGELLLRISVTDDDNAHRESSSPCSVS